MVLAGSWGGAYEPIHGVYYTPNVKRGHTSCKGLLTAFWSNPNGKGLWLPDGNWQSAIDELGDPAQPLTGKGRRIDLCQLLR